MKIKALKKLLENVDDELDVVISIGVQHEMRNPIDALYVTGIWNEEQHGQFVLVVG